MAQQNTALAKGQRKNVRHLRIITNLCATPQQTHNSGHTAKENNTPDLPQLYYNQ